MNGAKQLYQLQEVDLELESNEQALARIASQLGENEALVALRDKLVLEHKRLEELSQQQRSIEWEVDDLTNKLATAEGELYSGRIHNPKELTNLQHEIDGLKTKRKQLEDKALETMDQVELTTKSLANINSDLETMEAGWHSQQKQLSADMEQIKTKLTALKHKRQLLTADIDPQAVDTYQKLKKQKG